MELIKVSYNDLMQALEACVISDTPVFIWGSPGIGKSSVVRQVSKKLGFTDFRDVRLAHRDPTDVGCTPVPLLEEGRVKLLPPDYYNPKSVYSDEEAKLIRKRMEEDPDYRPSSRTLYFFDELNTAPPVVQAAAYQVVLERTIGPFKLGQFDYIVAAGNLMTDRGVTYKMPTPLANRFVHLELVVEPQEWIDNMLKSDEYRMHPFVIGFIKFKGGKALFDFDPKRHDRAFATPRSWEYASRLLYKNWNRVPRKIMTALIAGCVGDGLAHEFMAFTQQLADFPEIKDVLSGKVKTIKSTNHAVLYSYAVSLAYALREICEKEARRLGKTCEKMAPNELSENVQVMFDNYYNFIMQNFPREMVIMAAKLIVDLPYDTRRKVYDVFFEEYKDIIIKAFKV